MTSWALIQQVHKEEKKKRESACSPTPYSQKILQIMEKEGKMSFYPSPALLGLMEQKDQQSQLSSSLTTKIAPVNQVVKSTDQEASQKELNHQRRGRPKKPNSQVGLYSVFFFPLLILKVGMCT